MSSMTLKKIASLLNLSISTVSRALKDHPDISAGTIKRVKEVAESLDYEPNANAINLKTQNSRLFAVIVPGFSKFFYDSFIAGLEEECRKQDYSLMVLQNADNIETEKQNLKFCRLNRVSGVFAAVCTGTTEFREYEKVIDNGIPLLFFDKVPEDVRFNKVTINDEEAARMAAAQMAKKNSEPILAIFGNSNMSITRRRRAAFQDFITDKNVKVFYENANSSQEAQDIATAFLTNKKAGRIFCMSDEILIGVMNAVQKLQLPKTEVVCMSDGFFPTLYHPNITYVETSGFKLAKKAYEIMQGLIAEKKPAAEFYVEPVLVEG